MLPSGPGGFRQRSVARDRRIKCHTNPDKASEIIGGGGGPRGVESQPSRRAAASGDPRGRHHAGAMEGTRFRRRRRRRQPGREHRCCPAGRRGPAGGAGGEEQPPRGLQEGRAPTPSRPTPRRCSSGWAWSSRCAGPGRCLWTPRSGRAGATSATAVPARRLAGAARDARPDGARACPRQPRRHLPSRSPLRRPGSRAGRPVTGVEAKAAAGSSALRAPLVIGADGRSSPVARALGAPTRVVDNERFCFFAYFRNVTFTWPGCGHLWLLEPEIAYAFPTDGDLAILTVSPPRSALAEFRVDTDGAFRRVLARCPDGPDLRAPSGCPSTGACWRSRTSAARRCTRGGAGGRCRDRLRPDLGHRVRVRAGLGGLAGRRGGGSVAGFARPPR